MKTFIVPLTKSPHSSGRVGPLRFQDWTASCRIACGLQAKVPESKILLVSNVRVAGAASEVFLYEQMCLRFGARKQNIAEFYEGYETVRQIEVISKFSAEAEARVVLISTFLHYPRVRWLCRGKGFEHRAAWGIPRPREAVTDFLLWFLFPIIDICGWRERFANLVAHRRQGGKF